MTTCPKPGSHSSDQSQLITRLRSFAQTSRVQSLVHALGNDADLHLVGGCVREIAQSANNDYAKTDLDLATKLLPGEVANRLSRAKIHAILTGERHGTITAVVESSNVEITTFRIPGVVGKDVEKSYSNTILEDLSGRDFTINAIAFSINQSSLIDPSAGLKDLADKQLRAVGDPRTRFIEDPLRLLRMIRFGPARGFKVVAATEAAAKELSTSILSVSIERVREELVKILMSKESSAAFRKMHELSLLKVILPEFAATVGFEQNEYHRFDLFEHTLAVIENCPFEKDLRLVALFHDLGKVSTLTVDEEGRRHFYKHEIDSFEMCVKIMERLKFSNDEIKRVSLLVRHHMRPLECGPSGVRRLIRDMGTDLDAWMEFKRADSLGAKVSEQEIATALFEFETKLKVEHERSKSAPFAELAIGGEDLIGLGLKPGPQFGVILQTLHDAVLENPEINHAQSLLALARKIAK